jgi:hypothetical protein
LGLTVGTPRNTQPMTVREHMAIRLAATPYNYEGRREADMRELLGMSAPRFWMVVNGLLDRPDVEAAMPSEVHRLQRLRAQRQRQRQARRTGFAVQ